ncbi:MAG: hypothetical protein V3S04_00830 [Candidatus Omnitrophota bacterium]
MKDNTKKIILLVILVTIAAFNIARNLHVSSGERDNGVISSRDGGIRIAFDPSSAVRTAKRTSFESWKRSPFIPTEVAAREVPTLALSGIFWDDDKATAIIDNEIVTVGDRIGDIVVVDIQKNTVMLNDGENDYKLTLQE